MLLLDEPFSALDQELRHEMQDLLRQVRESLHPTVLMVTHDRDEAAAVADTIALIDHGRLIQHGSVNDLYRRPVSVEASRLMGGKNEICGTVRHGVHRSPWGEFRVSGCPPTLDGPATIVVRQESVEILRHGNTGISALVTAVHPVGARQSVTLSTGVATLHAETTAFRPVTVGERIRVRIPADEIALLR